MRHLARRKPGISSTGRRKKDWNQKVRRSAESQGISQKTAREKWICDNCIEKSEQRKPREIMNKSERAT